MDVLKYIIQIAEKLTTALLKVTFAALGMLFRTLGGAIAQAWRQRQQQQPNGRRHRRPSRVQPRQYRAPRRQRRRVRRRA